MFVLALLGFRIPRSAAIEALFDFLEVPIRRESGGGGEAHYQD